MSLKHLSSGKLLLYFFSILYCTNLFCIAVVPVPATAPQNASTNTGFPGTVQSATALVLTTVAIVVIHLHFIRITQLNTSYAYF